MDEILERELLLFETDKQFEKFVELYVELHNNSRLWENAGFTPMEMIERAEILESL